MSNVEYVCNVCGNRLFALPGGTKIKCPKSGGTIVRNGEQVPHGESEFIQKEGFGGPDFVFVDEDGNTASKDRLVGQEKLRAATPGQEAGADIDPDAELVAYRVMYESLTGLKVDFRWRVPTIKDQINQHMERMAEQKAEELAGSASGEQSTDETVMDDENDEGETDGDGPIEPDEPTSPGEVVEEIPGEDEDDEVVSSV